MQSITAPQYRKTSHASTPELLRRTSEWVAAGQLTGDRAKRALAAWCELNRRGYTDAAIRRAA